jgi:hypothetical protein
MTETNTAVVQAQKTRSFLPEEIQNLLLYWRDKFKQGYFEIGDLTAEIISEFSRSGVDISQQEIFNEIGKFVGKSGRTVRYYYETAVFYPDGVRGRYSALPFTHFVFARSVGNWQEVLDFALEHPTYSEDQLRREFMGVPPCLSDYLEGVVPPLPEAEEGPVSIPAETEAISKRYRYMNGIMQMRDGAKALKELCEVGDERIQTQDRQYLNWLAGELEQGVQYALKLIEKLV